MYENPLLVCLQLTKLKAIYIMLRQVNLSGQFSEFLKILIKILHNCETTVGHFTENHEGKTKK